MPNLSFIDFSGSIVGLIYNKNRRYQSTTGGVLSILMMLGIVSVAIVYLRDFFGRTKPKMSFEDMKYWNPPSRTLGADFQFAIVMKYNGVNLIKNDVIKTNAVYVSKNNTHSANRSIPSIPCTSLMDIGNGEIDSTFTPDLTNALCFDMSNVTLSGTKVTDVFQYVQIAFTLCLGDGECMPMNRMEQFFADNKPLALIYFLDTIFQTNDKKKVTYFYNSIDVNVTYGNSKETNVFFSKNEMLVDNSYFFPSKPLNHSYFMIDSFRDLVSVRTENQTNILSMNLMLSKNKRVIHLSYMQLSELMANISALANLIMTFFNLIGNLCNHHLFQTDLMQSLFNVNNSNSKRHSDDTITYTQRKESNNNNKGGCGAYGGVERFTFPKQNASIQSRDSTQNRILNSNSNNTNSQIKSNQSPSLFGPKPQGQSFLYVINKQHEKKKLALIHSKQAQIEKHSVQLSQKDLNKIITSNFFPMFFSKGFKQKKRSYETINDFMLVYQDQRNLFRKLQEIDLLKYLLLTEEQMSLYHNITKPSFITDSDQCSNKESGFSGFFCNEGCIYLTHCNNNNNHNNNSNSNLSNTDDNGHLNMSLKNNILSTSNSKRNQHKHKNKHQNMNSNEINRKLNLISV